MLEAVALTSTVTELARGATKAMLTAAHVQRALLTRLSSEAPALSLCVAVGHTPILAVCRAVPTVAAGTAASAVPARSVRTAGIVISCHDVHAARQEPVRRHDGHVACQVEVRLLGRRTGMMTGAGFVSRTGSPAVFGLQSCNMFVTVAMTMWRDALSSDNERGQESNQVRDLHVGGSKSERTFTR